MQSAHTHRVYQCTAHEDRDREAPKGWAEDQTELLMGKMRLAASLAGPFPILPSGRIR